MIEVLTLVMAAEFPEIGPGVLGGHLQTLTDLYKSLDDDFKTVLSREKGLYEFLLVPKVNILTSVVDKLLKYFDRNTSTFLINGQRLGITLQFVHLPFAHQGEYSFNSTLSK